MSTSPLTDAIVAKIAPDIIFEMIELRDHAKRMEKERALLLDVLWRLAKAGDPITRRIAECALAAVGAEAHAAANETL